jgi:hypothetical protein
MNPILSFSYELIRLSSNWSLLSYHFWDFIIKRITLSIAADLARAIFIQQNVNPPALMAPHCSFLILEHPDFDALSFLDSLGKNANFRTPELGIGLLTFILPPNSPSYSSLSTHTRSLADTIARHWRSISFINTLSSTQKRLNGPFCNSLLFLQCLATIADQVCLPHVVSPFQVFSKIQSCVWIVCWSGQRIISQMKIPFRTSLDLHRLECPPTFDSSCFEQLHIQTNTNIPTCVGISSLDNRLDHFSSTSGTFLIGLE